MKTKKLLPRLVIFHILTLMICNHLFAIDRKYETVILSGKHFNSYFGTPIENLYLMAFDDNTSSWIFIPYQIDERQQLINVNDTTYSYFASDDGIFDEFDELLFMANDVGDGVDGTNWPDFPDSENPIKRYEIAVIDTIGTTSNNIGFVYLCSSPDPIPIFEDYIYADQDNDKIISQNYEMGFIPESGLPKNLRIKAENGGDGQDFLDRLKIRLNVTVPFLGSLILTEDAILKVQDPQYITGPVRIIRNIPFNLALTSQFILPNIFNVSLQFFPYAMEVSLPDLDLSIISDYGSLDHIRVSTDYNIFADGMKLVNPHNEFPIDGMMSPAETNANKELNVPGLNWILASGNHGSMLTITDVPDIGDRTAFYYNDNKFPNLNDTGDFVSFGDSGFFIEGNIAGGGFSFISIAYFLPANLLKNDAEQLFLNQNSPLDHQINYQEDFTDVSENGSGVPQSFTLMRIYPNPYIYLNQRPLNIQINLKRSENVQFALYNLLGQQVAQIPATKYLSGEKTIKWNLGREPLHSGLYWLIARGNSGTLKEKLLILK